MHACRYTLFIATTNTDDDIVLLLIAIFYLRLVILTICIYIPCHFMELLYAWPEEYIEDIVN
jgi:hypothetical protein